MGRYLELHNYTETPTAFAEGGGAVLSEQCSAQDSERYGRPADG